MSRRPPAALVALLLSAIHAGCLTQRAYEKFEETPIEAGWVELIEATPSSVRLSVSTEYRAFFPRKSLIEFDPRLERCTSIRVLARTRTARAYLTPGVRHSLDVGSKDPQPLYPSASDWRSGEPSNDCTVCRKASSSASPAPRRRLTIAGITFASVVISGSMARSCRATSSVWLSTSPLSAPTT